MMSRTTRTLLFSVLFVAAVSQVSHAESIDSHYEQAISNTAVMKSSNEHALTPINDGTAHFIVWTDYTGYQPGAHYQMPINLFAARYDDMKNACSNFDDLDRRDSHLKMRINQLLGLPVYDAPQKFVELTVDVDQPNNSLLANYSSSSVGQAIFRPCGNPNVRDNSCGQDFAGDVTDDFKTWIYQKTRQSYHESTFNPTTHKFRYGYPWTDLGYTYNWGSNNHFGVEEFVIKKGADVNVVRQSDGSAYITAKQFCR